MTIARPLLAHTVPVHDDPQALRKLTYPLMWSPKLDGVRTLIPARRGGPVTRAYKDIPNDKVREFLSRPEFFGFDGECVFGPHDKGVFNRTQSAVMTIAGPSFEEADGCLWVFDDFSHPTDPFKDRFARLQERVSKLGGLKEFIVVVQHQLVHNADDLSNVEVVCVESGFEGVMVRDPNGVYKAGRSTLRDRILGKIKRFKDAEAEIIGYEEEMHNANEAELDEFGLTKRSSHQENLVGKGTLGALICRSPDFEETFKIGTGFTAKQREELWAMGDGLLGKTVTYLYQPSGMKDRPRFPSFKGLRSDHK